MAVFSKSAQRTVNPGTGDWPGEGGQCQCEQVEVENDLTVTLYACAHYLNRTNEQILS